MLALVVARRGRTYGVDGRAQWASLCYACVRENLVCRARVVSPSRYRGPRVPGVGGRGQCGAEFGRRVYQVLSRQRGEGVGDVQVDDGVCRLLVIPLLYEFEELVTPVWPSYAVLVFAGGVVYFVFVSVVDGSGC